MREFCRQCSHALTPQAAFCPGCGLPTGVAASGASTTPPPPTSPQGRSVRDFGGRSAPFGGSTPNMGMPSPSMPHPGMYVQDTRSTLDYLLMPWRRAFDFSGRSGRKEYWHFAVPVILVYIALTAILIFASESSGSYSSSEAETTTAIVIGITFGGWWLITLIPGIALAIRRLHDCDQSGWGYLAIFVVQILFAALAAIALIALGCMKGTIGPNRYGPDPTGAGAGDIFR